MGAALAVLLVVAAVWWSQQPGDEVAPGASSTPPTVAEPSEPGGGSTGDPGEPPVPGMTPEPGPDSPPPVAGTQAIEGYFLRDERTLALNYTTGVPECYGKVGEPRVEETEDAVIVTLEKSPPKNTRDVVCIDIAYMRSVDVTLESPLGDRVVLDGSREQTVIARADSPYGDGGEGEPAY